MSTYEDYHTAKAARQKGTCDWILQSDKFQEWLSQSESSNISKILWVHVKPGTGKTILSARIAEYMQEAQSALFAFFFCSNGNELKRNCNNIMKAWVAQIVKQDAEALTIALIAYREKDSTLANRFEIRRIFRQIAALGQ